MNPKQPASATPAIQRKNRDRPRFPFRVPLGIATLGCFLQTTPARLFAQGCIGPLSSPGVAMMEGDFQGISVGADQWTGTAGFQWFQSKRVFSGTKEMPQLYDQMANEVYTFDVSATYGVTARWSLSLYVPYSYATRTSKYEHDNVNFHTMTARGIGDVQFTTDVWLLNPHTHMSGNVALGIGFSAPTGDYDAEDTAYRATGPVRRPVDPSIQPGSGGWGIIWELQAFQKIDGNLFAYLNGSYTMTPQEQNSTEYTVADLNPAFFTPLQKYNSIPDRYFGRGGLTYVAWVEQGITVSLGARIDGVPANDAIGGSNGFRRPGYAISIEPGLSWNYKKNSFSVTAPVAVYRNRTQSAPEAELGRPAGTAAFADYAIIASFSHRF
jgi:hypothetical protein